MIPAKYRAAYSIAIQQYLQRRSTLLMDRLGGMAILLSLYAFWSALVAGKDSFLGYSGAQMVSYVLVMNLLRSFVFTGRGWELVGEISSGKISSYLVRPISYPLYSLALDFAQKTVHLGSAVLEVAVLAFAVGAQLYWPSWQSWLLFIPAVLISSLLFFFLEFLVSSMAFWTSESGGPLFCFELTLQFAAGTFFPLDVLPAAMQRVLQYTPFPYMVFYPINIYLERISVTKSLSVLFIQLAWLSVVLLLCRKAWRAGLDSYSAEGG